MKTIRTILLIFTLLCGIVPATAEVNFTEKTYFLASDEYYNTSYAELVTSMYLNKTVDGITLSSSSNQLKLGQEEPEFPGNLRWNDNSCNASAKSVNKNYFQITSSDKPIKYLSVRTDADEKGILIVGWKGTVGSTIDYYIDSTIPEADNYRWTTFNLSSWEDVKTVRLYVGATKAAGLKLNNKEITKTQDGDLLIYGIQVGLSSNSTTIGTYGFSAFSSTSPLDFTNVTDCNAYYADSYANGTLHLTKATGVVPANFGLLLCASKDATTSVCIPVATAEQLAACKLTANDNRFVATSNITYKPESSTDALALGVKDNKAGFYYVGANVAVPQNKMYLPAAKVGGAKSVTLDFGGIDPTGIVNVNSDDAANMPSAQRPATDLLGRPVTNPMPGQIYIKDGKAFKLTY